MKIPLDSRIRELRDLPYTITYVIRKRIQIDNLNELSKDKRPPEDLIWDKPPEEMEKWLEDVLDFNHKKDDDVIYIEDIEE